MAIQSNQTFMTDLEFQRRFPELYKQQAQQKAQQGGFGGPLGFGMPYQGLTLDPMTAPSTGGVPPPVQASTSINDPFNLGSGVYGNVNTPSNLASNMYGTAGSTFSGASGIPTNQPAFGSIVKPAAETSQAAFGTITQPTQPTTDNLVKEVVGQDGQKPAVPNESGMTDELINQLQIAENARIDKLIREEQEKEAQRLAEEAKLTPQQRVEKYTPVLKDQILGQKLTDKWSGQGHGSAEANATDMARILSSIGITDIRQFGKVDKYEPVQEGYKTYNGYRVTKTYADENGLNGGKYVYTRPTDKIDGEGFPILETAVVPEGGKLESHYGFAEDFGEGGSTFTPVDSSKVVNRNGVMFAPSGKTTYGNKETGQEVPLTYSERQTGNAWGGTFAGKGNTGYRVDFTDDGMPVFYTTGASSSDIGALAPFLTLASFIPGVAPFAQGLNALIAAKQGNILGAIGGFAGLGSQIPGLSGLSNVSKAANFAGALKSKNPLGIISAGANLGGTDMAGLANSAGLGGLADLNIGGFGVSDALKAARAVKAVQSGNPSAIISALGGYATDFYDQNKNTRSLGASSSLPDSAFASKQGPRASDSYQSFNLPSVDEDFSSSYGLSRSKDDLSASLPDLPSIDEDFASTYKLPSVDEDFASTYKLPSIDEDFPSSFAKATPKQTSRSVAAARPAAYDSVGGGRGGQGGATAEEIARYNAVRGNAPQTDVARFVSSLFPSAQAGSLKESRTPDAASQIPGQSVRAPASTYDKENSMIGRLADELGLPPELQRNISNTLSALPGVNMPVGAVGRLAGAADELGASAALRAGDGRMYVEPTRLTADPSRMFKMIQDLPNDVYKTTAVQNALKAIAEGDNVAAYRALESNPSARKELLKYAEKLGAKEVSPFKQGQRFNPPENVQRMGGGYSPRVRKAEGGLASLKKRQTAKA
jgi:hypothetical protein